MISLAVSDSPLARQGLAQGWLAADYLETSGPLVESAVAQFPLSRFLLHNAVYDWSLADPTSVTPEIESRTQASLALTRAPWLSIHLGFSAARVHFDGWMRATSPVLPRDDLIRAMCLTVRAIAARLPVPVLLENLDYCAGGAYEHICQPKFIADVIAETGAALLLDIAHAQVSAHRLGWTIDDYLAALPLERVRQVHVSGPRERDGQLADAHDTLTERDERVLSIVLGRCLPDALTLEYRREQSALVLQIERLRDLLAGRAGGLHDNALRA